LAYEDAAKQWEGALDLLEDGGGDDITRATLLARLGDVHFVSGLDAERSNACLTKALALFETLDMTEQVAQVHSRLGRNLSTFPDKMDIARALQHQAKAEAFLSERTSTSALGYLYSLRALAHHWALRTPDGLRDPERAISIASEIGNQRLRRHASALLGTNLAAAGHLSEGVKVLQDNWADADAARDGQAAFSTT